MVNRKPRVKQIPDDRQDKFVYQSSKDIKFQKGASFPKSLEKVVKGIPKDDEKALFYLQNLVQTNKITPGQFKFILLATANPGPYRFE